MGRAAQKDGPQGDVAREILAERPVLSRYEDYFFEVFGILATTRPGGDGPKHIPITAIWAFCDRRGLSGMRADIMERVITRIDRAYINLLSERMKKLAAK